MFKFEGNQQVWLIESKHPVTIFGRTEFFNGKQPRYYVQSEEAIPGKNVSEDWVNEDKLSDVQPVETETVVQKTDTLGSVRKSTSVRKGI